MPFFLLLESANERELTQMISETVDPLRLIHPTSALFAFISVH